MLPEPPGHPTPGPAEAVHYPTPIPTPAPPLVPYQPHAAPVLHTVQLPDGRIVTGYTLTPTTPAPAAVPEQVPAVSRTALNLALAGVGFAGVCGGLLLLTTFIAALTALLTQLVILAAVIFGGLIAAQILGHRPHSPGTTVHIRKAVIKRNHFHT
ncbi:hypothetical protein RM780_08605 [Streptomyces sp. DSM 44917]|uniref:SpdD-like protein n=1 Tax=Streptomyces boetiae TaxID=3075541 RepID=A0ABU2L634_9ACTN|nr:hypothetical protein [Streptomyces sp. DSM 44917]MDT0307022.1 hypothetical protein [Streptomyces sp. DSM 44917]